MTGGDLRTTVVWIAQGDKTEVYRSPKAIPAERRRRLFKAVNAPNAVSIVIADAGGREQLGRAVLGLPAQLPDRVRRKAKRWFGGPRTRLGWHVWGEITVIGALGLALWLLLAGRF